MDVFCSDLVDKQGELINSLLKKLEKKEKRRRRKRKSQHDDDDELPTDESDTTDTHSDDSHGQNKATSPQPQTTTPEEVEDEELGGVRRSTSTSPRPSLGIKQGLMQSTAAAAGPVLASTGLESELPGPGQAGKKRHSLPVVAAPSYEEMQYYQSSPPPGRQRVHSASVAETLRSSRDNSQFPTTFLRGEPDRLSFPLTHRQLHTARPKASPGGLSYTVTFKGLEESQQFPADEPDVRQRDTTTNDVSTV